VKVSKVAGRCHLILIISVYDIKSTKSRSTHCVVDVDVISEISSIGGDLGLYYRGISQIKNCSC